MPRSPIYQKYHFIYYSVTLKDKEKEYKMAIMQLWCVWKLYDTLRYKRSDLLKIENNKFLYPRYFSLCRYCLWFACFKYTCSIFFFVYINMFCSGHQGQLFQSGEALNILLLFIFMLLLHFCLSIIFCFLKFFLPSLLWQFSGHDKYIKEIVLHFRFILKKKGQE